MTGKPSGSNKQSPVTKCNFRVKIFFDMKRTLAGAFSLTNVLCFIDLLADKTYSALNHTSHAVPADNAQESAPQHALIDLV